MRQWPFCQKRSTKRTIINQRPPNTNFNTVNLFHMSIHKNVKVASCHSRLEKFLVCALPYSYIIKTTFARAGNNFLPSESSILLKLHPSVAKGPYITTLKWFGWKLRGCRENQFGANPTFSDRRVWERKSGVRAERCCTKQQQWKNLKFFTDKGNGCGYILRYCPTKSVQYYRSEN